MSEPRMAPEIIQMIVGETDLIKEMDFSDGDDLASDETLSQIDDISWSPTTTPDLSVVPNGVSGKSAQVKIGGGLAGTEYVIEITVITSLSQKPIGQGRLKVWG